MIWLDDYERRARLLPGLWLLAPVIIAGVTLGLDDYPLISLAAGGVSAFGGPVLLAGFVRDRGLAMERALVSSWGGWPTTQLLCHGSPEQVKRRRAAVERVAETKLPPKAELKSPEYDVVIGVVRARTRDKDRFQLLFVENRNYGFERNLLAVRSIGLCISFAMFIVVGVGMVALSLRDSKFQPELLLGWAIIALLLVGWWWVPSAERVKTMGFKYAERLLEACEVL